MAGNVAARGMAEHTFKHLIDRGLLIFSAVLELFDQDSHAKEKGSLNVDI